MTETLSLCWIIRTYEEVTRKTTLSRRTWQRWTDWMCLCVDRVCHDSLCELPGGQSGPWARWINRHIWRAV